MKIRLEPGIKLNALNKNDCKAVIPSESEGSKKLRKMKKYILPVLAISMLIAIPVFGATTTFDNPLGETSDISTLLKNIIGFLIVLAIPISAILIVYAGYLYITSAGNEEKIKTAQKTLIWALIGFAIVLIAKGVPAIIQEFLSGKEESPAEVPAEAPEAPTESAEPDGGETPSEPAEPAEEETAEEEKIFVKTCWIDPSSSASPECSLAEWKGTGPKPNDECATASECEASVYYFCWTNGLCTPGMWHGTQPKPNDECKIHSDCQPSSATEEETPVSEQETEPVSKCFDCGGTAFDFNVCDEKECLALGDCYFSPSTWLVWTPGCYPNSK